MVLDAGVVGELAGIVGPDNVRSALGELTPYTRDAKPLFTGEPDAVVLPANTGGLRGPPLGE